MVSASPSKWLTLSMRRTKFLASSRFICTLLPVISSIICKVWLTSRTPACDILYFPHIESRYSFKCICSEEPTNELVPLYDDEDAVSALFSSWYCCIGLSLPLETVSALFIPVLLYVYSALFVLLRLVLYFSCIWCPTFILPPKIWFKISKLFDFLFSSAKFFSAICACSLLSFSFSAHLSLYFFHANWITSIDWRRIFLSL